jgi:hypothetical protein
MIRAVLASIKTSVRLVAALDDGAPTARCGSIKFSQSRTIIGISQ